MDCFVTAQGHGSRAGQTRVKPTPAYLFISPKSKLKPIFAIIGSGSDQKWTHIIR